MDPDVEYTNFFYTQNFQLLCSVTMIEQRHGKIKLTKWFLKTLSRFLKCYMQKESLIIQNKCISATMHKQTSCNNVKKSISGRHMEIRSQLKIICSSTKILCKRKEKTSYYTTSNSQRFLSVYKYHIFDVNAQKNIVPTRTIQHKETCCSTCLYKFISK